MTKYALYVGKSREMTGSLITIVSQTDEKTTFEFDGQMYRCANKEVKLIGNQYITRSRKTTDKIFVKEFASQHNFAGRYNDNGTKLSRAA